jgi:hypothetical protein
MGQKSTNPVQFKQARIGIRSIGTFAGSAWLARLPVCSLYCQEIRAGAGGPITWRRRLFASYLMAARRPLINCFLGPGFCPEGHRSGGPTRFSYLRHKASNHFNLVCWPGTRSSQAASASAQLVRERTHRSASGEFGLLKRTTSRDSNGCLIALT